MNLRQEPQPEEFVFVEPLKRGRYDDGFGVPLNPSFFERVPFSCLSASKSQLAESEAAGFELVQPARGHGRALDVRFKTTEYGDTTSPQFIFGDEFGNVFASLGTKGNVGTSICAVNYELEPSGLRMNGLQDASLIDRVVSISERLREAGADTEWIIAARQPKTYPYFGGFMGHVGLRGLREGLKKENSDIVTEIFEMSEEQRKKMLPTDLSELDSLQFTVTYRALKTPYRLTDIYELPEPEQQKVMESVIKVHNVEERRKHRKDPEYVPRVVSSDTEGCWEFITEVLPHNVGRNLAIMHNLGMWHRYLHPGNISLLGGIYDLDSVSDTSQFVDDEQLSLWNALRDVEESFGSEHNVDWFSDICGQLFLSDAHDARGNYVRLPNIPELDDKVWTNFLSIFYDNYLGTRDFGRKPELSLVFRCKQVMDGAPPESEVLGMLPEGYRDLVVALSQEQKDRLQSSVFTQYSPGEKEMPEHDVKEWFEHLRYMVSGKLPSQALNVFHKQYLSELAERRFSDFEVLVLDTSIRLLICAAAGRALKVVK